MCSFRLWTLQMFAVRTSYMLVEVMHEGDKRCAFVATSMGCSLNGTNMIGFSLGVSGTLVRIVANGCGQLGNQHFES